MNLDSVQKIQFGSAAASRACTRLRLRMVSVWWVFTLAETTKVVRGARDVKRMKYCLFEPNTVIIKSLRESNRLSNGLVLYRKMFLLRN